MLITRSHLEAFAILAGLATVIAVQRQTYSQHRGENLKLRAQASQLDEHHARNQTPNSILPASEAPLSQLLRLRAEVSGLRKQLAEAGDARTKLQAARKQTFDANAKQMEAFKASMVSNTHLMEECMPAFMTYVEKNHGQFPSSIEQARPFLPTEAQAGISFMAQNFELTFQGSLSNLPEPASVIVMRLKEPMQTPGKGAWLKAYIFADGHSDIHLAPDGDFTTWEQQHSAKAAGP